MSEHLLSDTAERETGWNSFEIWKTAIHQTRTRRYAGQSWADYMDDLEDQEFFQQRRQRRLVRRALLVCIVALTVCVVYLLR